MASQILLNHAEPIAEPFRNLCVFLALCNHCLGVLTSSRVCCCNLCEALLCSRPRACPSVQPAAAISFVCWAFARQALTCFGATSLARPVSAKARLNANQNIAFCYHSDSPEHEVSFYHKFCEATRGPSASAWTTFVGCGGRI